MFTVTSLDLENVPKTEDNEVDYSEDFFGQHTALTVSGQLHGESWLWHLARYIHSGLLSEQKTPTQQGMPQSSG